MESDPLDSCYTTVYMESEYGCPLGSGEEGIAFCQRYTSGNTIPAFAANCDDDVTKVLSDAGH